MFTQVEVERPCNPLILLLISNSFSLYNCMQTVSETTTNCKFRWKKDWINKNKIPNRRGMWHWVSKRNRSREGEDSNYTLANTFKSFDSRDPEHCILETRVQCFSGIEQFRNFRPNAFHILYVCVCVYAHQLLSNSDALCAALLFKHCHSVVSRRIKIH